MDICDILNTWMQVKLEDVENSNMKNGRKIIGKLDDKIRDLVAEIDNEGRKKSDSLKNLKKTERSVNEYIYKSKEDQKNSKRIKVKNVFLMDSFITISTVILGLN